MERERKGSRKEGGGLENEEQKKAQAYLAWLGRALRWR